MPQLTFLQLAQKVLEEEQQPLTPSELWKLAQAKGYDKEMNIQGKTPWATLGAQLYVDVRDNLNSIFAPIGTRPKRFVLRSLVKGQTTPVPTPASSAVAPEGFKYLEKDLHPFLAYYGFYYLKAYLKTIQHTRVRRREFGEWVHPDMIGCYFPFGDWEEEVVEVSTLLANNAVQLYSFELKRELSVTNIREAFFQAVSNSSWANEGYLVAAEIDTDDEFRTELKRLSASFGIGIIQLDIEDPDSTQTILPARSRETVDWEAVNKLASLNQDFRDFLKRIKTDISSREVRRELYDRVLSKEELLTLLKKEVNQA
jgi:hypothetical protein